METLESFAHRIQHLRVARSLSERDLAQRIGITVCQYQSLVGFGTPPTSLLVDLADALDVTFAQLTAFTEEASTSAQADAFVQELRCRRAAIAWQLRCVDQQL